MPKTSVPPMIAAVPAPTLSSASASWRVAPAGFHNSALGCDGPAPPMQSAVSRSDACGERRAVRLHVNGGHARRRQRGRVGLKELLVGVVAPLPGIAPSRSAIMPSAETMA